MPGSGTMTAPLQEGTAVTSTDPIRPPEVLDDAIGRLCLDNL